MILLTVIYVYVYGERTAFKRAALILATELTPSVRYRDYLRPNVPCLLLGSKAISFSQIDSLGYMTSYPNDHIWTLFKPSAVRPVHAQLPSFCVVRPRPGARVHRMIAAV